MKVTARLTFEEVRAAILERMETQFDNIPGIVIDRAVVEIQGAAGATVAIDLDDDEPEQQAPPDERPVAVTKKRRSTK